MTEYIKRNILLALVLIAFTRCLFWEKSYLDLILLAIVTIFYTYFEYKFNEVKIQAINKKINDQKEELDNIKLDFIKTVHEIKDYHLTEVKVIKDQLASVRVLHQIKQNNTTFK